MGWTSYYPELVNGKVNRKNEILNLFTASGESGTWKPLKIAFHGSTAYLAVEKTMPSGEKFVYGAVVLTRTTKKGEFFYKDMDESMGPCYYDCPVSIINMLSLTDNEYAKGWREKCLENFYKNKAKKADENSLNNLPVGTKISFTANDKKIIAVKADYKPHFKRPIWTDGKYRYPTKSIERVGYSVLSKGE